MHTPQSTPGRLVLGAWWLTIVVLMNAFTGHMKATMMLFPDPERIDSFRDLSRQTDITPFLWRGGAYEDLLKLYNNDNLRMVLEGKAVIVSDYTTMLYHASRTCRQQLAAGRYYFAKEPTFPTPLAMAVDRSVDPALTQFIDQR
ncbi:hypothetical protein HPB52_010123 [Rhipicephalus sanguineus]|uniref:Ionotropic glutamate receptor C-terminal domain-containing protein n=1 Tax=Rhipicephalus sanguineus TaxID=34632 RepID=A0A9D4T1P5_RHISA|nr:hypothetical protein HPB52_010123 [Rhipicephalus sanguineus]